MKYHPAILLDITQRRAPHGARGLKYSGKRSAGKRDESRPPRARGLKYVKVGIDLLGLLSRPPRGAWVEILGVLAVG